MYLERVQSIEKLRIGSGRRTDTYHCDKTVEAGEHLYRGEARKSKCTTRLYSCVPYRSIPWLQKGTPLTVGRLQCSEMWYPVEVQQSMYGESARTSQDATQTQKVYLSP